MKILFFSYEFPQLGSEAGETCFYLLNEYAKLPEMEIDFLTISLDGEYHLLKMGENISIHKIPIGDKILTLDELTHSDMFRFARRAYKFSRGLSKENKYDLSHAFFSFPSGLSSLILYWRMKLPFIVSLQNSDISLKNSKLIDYAIKKISQKAYFLISDNSKLCESLSSSFHNKEINFLNKGIDLQKFFPDESKKRADQFMILCDSEVTPIKGIRFLIQAVKILSGRYSQVRISIIGDGNDKNSLQDLVRGLEISDKVDFVGELSSEESLKYYQVADVFVSPSLDEEIDNGIKIRCALASGLAVVATPVNGVKGLVFDKQNGFLVKISTADDLAEKIETLVLDENLRALMAKNSLELANQLSWKNVSSQYMNFYDKTKNIAHIRN